jgi:hypothetical protein
MSRLQAELARLYASPHVDAQGQVRALVLEVAQPAGWEALSRAWQGVQAELELPAPAIAVSGVDGLQLWFSLAAPIAMARAHAFLESLRARYLDELPIARVRLWPDPALPARHAASVPALQPETGNWSAFVSPDLAAIFSDTPWLDIEPGDEGQAALLRGLRSTAPAAFEAAVAQLQAPAPAPATAPAAPAAPVAPTTSEEAARRFLLGVMNDEGVALALRIEAAKALL